MAVTWGSWSNLSRLGIDLVRTSQSASAETWAVTVWVETKGYVADNYNTVTVSGAFTFSGNVPVNLGSAGTVKLWESSKSFARQYGKNVTQSVAVSLTEFAAGSPSYSRSFTVEARPYSVPNAPGSASARRSTDRAAVVSWETPSAGAGNPFTAFYLERSVNGGSYARATHIASKTATSWTDTGTSAGNYYRYRVRAENEKLKSDWADSGYVYMTPNAPANVVASKDGNDVIVSWVNRAVGSYTTTIFEGDTVVKAGIGSGTGSFRIVSPSTTVPHTYSLAHVAGGLTSARTTANTVQIAVPPNAPTDLTPNGEPQPAGSPVRLSFTHNPGDNSTQTGFRLGYRRSTSGEYTWVENRATGDGFYDLPASAATVGTVYWTVATWGEHADLGAYAPEARFELVTRPTVTVTAPSTAQTDKATVTITTPVTGPVAWEAEATINGEIVTSGGYGTSPFAWELNDLPNGATVSVRARVMTRVWSQWRTAAFTVAYAAPAQPVLDAVLADYAATLTVSTPESGAVAAVGSRIQRQRLDGSWETLLDEADPEVTLTDTTVALNRPTTYRAGSISATGVVAWSETVTVDPGTLDKVTVFNFGDGLGQSAIIRYNPTIGENAGWAFEQSYVFAGQTVPTTIRGRARTLAQRFTGLIQPETMFTFADVEAWRALAGWEGLVLCRRPDAEPLLGVASDVALSPEIWGGYQISLTHTESK